MKITGFHGNNLLKLLGPPDSACLRNAGNFLSKYSASFYNRPQFSMTVAAARPPEFVNLSQDLVPVNSHTKVNVSKAEHRT